MREDPRMIFQEWREEGFFRILVSRYLMDDEKLFRTIAYFGISKFQVISVYEPFVQF